MPVPAIGQSERATQSRVIKLFQDELGYDYLGDWSDRSNSNVEEEYLAANLKRRGYSATHISRALDRLRSEAINPIEACMTTIRRFIACCAMACQ